MLTTLKPNTMRGKTQLQCSYHGCWQFSNHRHVDGHIGTALDSNAPEVVANLANGCKELLVGESALLPQIVSLQVEGYLPALPLLHMTIQAVVADVCLCTNKPFHIYGSRVQVKVVAAKKSVSATTYVYTDCCIIAEDRAVLTLYQYCSPLQWSRVAQVLLIRFYIWNEQDSKLPE